MAAPGEESIYNLIPTEYHAPSKPPKYISKFNPNVRDEHSSNKEQCKTMGQAKVKTRAPNEFLRKKEADSKKASNPKSQEKFTYPDEDRRRPPVPKRDDRPLMGMKTTKNFITQNAVENIMSVPTKPAKNFVDTRSGDKQPLEPSGMEPKYINKKDFGNVPNYLVKRNEDVKKAQEEYDAYVAEHFKRGAMKQLSPSERNEILTGLKANWEQLHHEYQGLSVVTDTTPKKNRKERMEAEMKQLERDIETIEKHAVIYIA